MMSYVCERDASPEEVVPIFQESSIDQNFIIEDISVAKECLVDSDILSDTEDLEPVSQPDISEETESKNSYYEDWNHLFKDTNYVELLRFIGLKGLLRNCRFRSICWKVYLECLSEDKSLWVEDTILQREKYDKFCCKLLTNPRCDSGDVDFSINNPLSQSEESPWHHYFQDEELKKTIQQDVRRTFPEVEFFHTNEVQEMMVNVLFCYARQFPHISYRQGMHELLAPLIFVLHSDQQAYLHASELELLEMFDPSTRKDLFILLDPAYTEHDAFFLFCQLMESVENWYVMDEIVLTKVNFNLYYEPFQHPPDVCPANALVVKLIRINEQLLRHRDPDLYSHLNQLEIVPQIYGIRWLRLLFGREFAIQDLLVIWDAIFANSLSFDLVDYIFTAMLIFIRDLLLDEDYTSCISHLMRYPAVADVHYLINLALHLKNPTEYPKPVGYSSQMLQHVPLVGGRKEIHRAPSHIVPNNSLILAESVTEKSERTRPTSLDLPDQCSNFVPAPTKQQSVDLGREAVAGKLSAEEEEDESSDLSDFKRPHSSLSLHNHKRPPACMMEEIFPLVPQDAFSRTQHDGEYLLTLQGKGAAGIDYLEKNVEKLTAQVADMQTLIEYCTRMMTAHLNKLQFHVGVENLQHEDEILVALAGLKMIRDVLSGKVGFSKEVVDGDVMLEPQMSPSDNHKPSNSMQTAKVEDLTVVKKTMCDNAQSKHKSSEKYRYERSDSGAKLCATNSKTESSTGFLPKLGKFFSLPPSVLVKQEMDQKHPDV